jgi:hypothetical protein
MVMEAWLASSVYASAAEHAAPCVASEPPHKKPVSPRPCPANAPSYDESIHLMANERGLPRDAATGRPPPQSSMSALIRFISRGTPLDHEGEAHEARFERILTWAAHVMQTACGSPTPPERSTPRIENGSTWLGQNDMHEILWRTEQWALKHKKAELLVHRHSEGEKPWNPLLPHGQHCRLSTQKWPEGQSLTWSEERSELEWHLLPEPHAAALAGAADWCDPLALALAYDSTRPVEDVTTAFSHVEGRARWPFEAHWSHLSRNACPLVRSYALRVLLGSTFASDHADSSIGNGYFYQPELYQGIADPAVPGVTLEDQVVKVIVRHLDFTNRVVIESRLRDQMRLPGRALHFGAQMMQHDRAWCEAHMAEILQATPAAAAVMMRAAETL